MVGRISLGRQALGLPAALSELPACYVCFSGVMGHSSCAVRGVAHSEVHMRFVKAPSVLQPKVSLSFSWKLRSLDTRCGRRLHAGSNLSTHNSLRGSLAVASIPRRRLILLRHGKSSWSDPSLKDHDRHLNEHGRLASVSLAGKLQEIGWLPDLILCSDSMRTRETLEVMENHIQELADVEVHFLGSFYSVAAMDGQTAQHLQETICKYARDNIYTVMCMGHNRGWEEAATIFSGLSVELKTSNAALLEAHGSSWEEAFNSAGPGGWKLFSIVKPGECDE